MQQERRSWADQFEQVEGNETEDEWLKKWEKEQEDLKSKDNQLVACSHA